MVALAIESLMETQKNGKCPLIEIWKNKGVRKREKEARAKKRGYI